MPTWSSEQYLRFARERTQPSIDLAARVPLAAPRSIIDLGCGPGNSTDVLARRWPQAELTGLDSSASMLASARQTYPSRAWIQSDIAMWAAHAGVGRRYELVFSNAALHWVPDHATVIPQIFAAVAPGGVLAFQVPHSLDAPHQRCIRQLALGAAWRSRFTRPPVTWHVEPVEFYYDVLAPLASRLEVWSTDYVLVLDSLAALVDWHAGAALRPFLDALPSEDARAEFTREYAVAVAPHYPPRRDGKILLPFRRLFVLACA